MAAPRSAKYRPDGFLYYQISIWRPEAPIEAGPFTAWDPVSWTTNHGDGSWTCVGPGGRPLPTIRLENFRDGLEDLACFQALEEAVRRKEAAGAASEGDKAWLSKAKAALQVPEELVSSVDASAIALPRSLDDILLHIALVTRLALAAPRLSRCAHRLRRATPQDLEDDPEAGDPRGLLRSRRGPCRDPLRVGSSLRGAAGRLPSGNFPCQRKIEMSAFLQDRNDRFLQGWSGEGI